jgi:hypothetical protein
MSEKVNSPTSFTRTSSRRSGRHLTKAERRLAQETFIEAYRLNGNIMLSCRRANIDRSTYYIWMEQDEQFSFAVHQAERDFADLALAEFRKRAMEGYERPVISMGRIVWEEVPVTNSKTGEPVIDSKGNPVMRRTKPMMERVVSDNLLAMLIKKHFPEYREKQQIEHSGSIDVNGARDALLNKLTALPQEQEDHARKE